MSNAWQDLDLEVVVLGPAVVELRGDAPLDEATTFRRAVGGDGGVAALAASRAGAVTALATHVGDDPFGRWLIQRWEAEGLHLDFTREVARPNALAVVGADLHRFTPLPLPQTAAGTLAPADVGRIPWSLARVLLLTGATQAAGPEARAAVARAASEAHAAGVRVVYDAALSPSLWAHAGDQAPRRALEELIPSLDTLVVSAPYGAGRLLGQPAPDAALQAALALGIPHVVVRESPNRKRPADTLVPGAGRPPAGSTEAPHPGEPGPEVACSVASGEPGAEPARVPLSGTPRPADGGRRRSTFDGVLAAALAKGAPLSDAVRAALKATLLPADDALLPTPRSLEALLTPWGRGDLTSGPA